MKKLIMKNRVMGLCTVICAGMLLLTGCTGKEVKTGSDAASERKETSVETEPVTQGDSKVEPIADDEKKIQEQNTFTNGNDMISSANLAGPASGCSDTGCMINTDSFASVDEDGNSPSGNGGSTKVVYTEDTVFEKGTVKSDGSGAYSLEDSEKSELKENDYVLCFGNQQADGSYQADRIIMITFN